MRSRRIGPCSSLGSTGRARTGQGPVRLLLAPVQVYVRRVPLALTPRYGRFVMPGGEWRKQISPRKEKIAWDIDFALFMPEWSTENIGL